MAAQSIAGRVGIPRGGVLIGGGGDSGGRGGFVTVNHTCNIKAGIGREVGSQSATNPIGEKQTGYSSTDCSRGILAQSIGGGNGGTAVSLQASASLPGFGALSVSTAIGGGAGNGGSSEGTTVTSDADITTKGARFAGIRAQAIGGGGGVVGDAASDTPGPATVGSSGGDGASDGVFGNTGIFARTVEAVEGEAGMTVKYEGTAGLDVITVDGGKIKGQIHLPKVTLQINEGGTVQSTGPVAAESVKNNGQRTLGAPDAGELQTGIPGDFAQGKSGVLISV